MLYIKGNVNSKVLNWYVVVTWTTAKGDEVQGRIGRVKKDKSLQNQTNCLCFYSCGFHSWDFLFIKQNKTKKKPLSAKSTDTGNVFVVYSRTKQTKRSIKKPHKGRYQRVSRSESFPLFLCLSQHPSRAFRHFRGDLVATFRLAPQNKDSITGGDLVQKKPKTEGKTTNSTLFYLSIKWFGLKRFRTPLFQIIPLQILYQCFPFFILLPQT